MQQIRHPTTTDTGKLFLLGAIWGSAFLCIDIAVADFPPITIAATRVLIAAIVLGTLSRLAGQNRPRDPRTLLLLLFIGFLNSALPFVLISWGQQYIPGGQSAVLMATGPIVALLLSHYMTADDRFSIDKAGGIVLGFSGVIVLVGADVLGGHQRPVFGQLAVMSAAACYAISAVITRHVAHVPPLMNSAIVLGTAALYMVPLALAVDHPWELQPSYAASLTLLFLGLVPTALAYLLRFQIVQFVGATFMSQVSYLVPLFAVFWGWLFLDQVPLRRSWVALALILTGVYISRRAPRGKK
jgi:drug/metabolite transporter (DMT)-like permease